MVETKLQKQIQAMRDSRALLLKDVDRVQFTGSKIEFNRLANRIMAMNIDLKYLEALRGRGLTEQIDLRRKQQLREVAVAKSKSAVIQKRQQATEITKLTGMQKSQYDAFRKRYSPTEALRLTEWSMKYKMSPTSETARRILQGIRVEPDGRAESRAISKLARIEKSQYESFKKRGYNPRQSLILTDWSVRAKMSPTRETASRILAGRKVIPTPTLRAEAKRKAVAEERVREIKLPFKQRIRDITSFGLTREAREREIISKQIESFNKEVERFEKRFGGRELEPKEFALAKKEEEKLNRLLKNIEKREEEIKKAIPTIISEKTAETAKSLRKEKLKIIEEKGVKAHLDPRLKRIDKKLQGLGIAQSFISAGIGILVLPETIGSLIKEPSQLKKVPSALGEAAKQFARIAIISPTEAVAKIGAEVFLLKGTGKILQVTGKLSTKAAAKVSGKLTKVKGSTITIKTGQVGKKTIDIKVLGPGLKKIKETLAEQAELVGKRLPIVTSSQANKIVSIIKRQRTIKKPIPNEKLLKSSTKKLLKKFDEGKITRNEVIRLDRRIRKETKGAGSLLERSFFVDPKGRVRLSRLGIQKEATISDIIRGDFTLKTQKPQIIFFRDIKVQDFPKTKIFKNINKKLKFNKALTTKEYQELLKFQIKRSGKFKPIGALSKEPELTIAPGEIVKKVKTVAKVEINGKIVPIVQAQVVKATKQTSKLLKQSKIGKLTKKEARTLKRRLRKETRFKASEFSRTTVKPRVPVKRLLVTPITRIARRVKRVKPKPTKRIPTGRPRKKPKPRPAPRPKPRKPRIRRPPRKVPKEVPRVPGVPRIRRPPPPPPIPRPRPRPRPPAKPIPPLPRVKKRIPKKKPVRKPQAFSVFARPLKKKGQKKPKLIKVSKVPLSKKRAKDLRNYITDTSLGRTARIKPSIGKPTTPKLKVPKGYAKRTSPKFRRYKVVKRKRVPLPKGKVIEKSKYLLDTSQEKKQITLKRRIAQLSKPPKEVPRVISKPKRKVSQTTLDILKAGREKRLANLKKKK